METNIIENVYKTVCPGCNIGCGVYVRQLKYNVDFEKLSIDYRKSDPVNEGKLCTFGVHLSEYYSSSNFSNFNEENRVFLIEKFKKICKYNCKEIAFLNIGNSTNEEHLAFMDIANILGTTVSNGLSSIYKNLKGLHNSIVFNVSYSDISKFKKIYVFCDLSVQYPLLIRYLLNAQKNGSNIISIGIKNLSFSSNHIFLDHFESIYSIKELNFDKDTLIISDITQYSNLKRLAEIVEISNLNCSNTLFLKPFVNTTGIGHLSKHTKQNSIDEILDLINNGLIKVLVCLETDIVGISLDSKVEEILKKLDELIVISSKNTKTTEIATIVFKVDPFYMRYGTIINCENRLISQFLMTNINLKKNTCFDLLETIIENIGGHRKTFEEMEDKLFSVLNINETDKTKELLLNRNNKLNNENKIIKISSSFEEFDISNKKDMLMHSYLFSPYFWSCINKYNDFVELNMHQIQSLNILKDYTIDISCEYDNSKMISKYKVSDIKDGNIISWNKKKFAGKPFSFVSIEKTK